ncbi:MAG TPA: class I tRNA ligase family protein, partial [Micavibrio sp.]
FLERAWSLLINTETGKLNDFITDEKEEAASDELRREINITVKKVGEDIENMRFNTSIAKMMELVNLGKKQDKFPKEIAEKFVLVLAPFAPHMAEELWSRLGHAQSLAYAPWPSYDSNWLQSDSVLITVHINGKKRAEIQVGRGQTEAEVKKIAQDLPAIAKNLEGQNIKKVIFVPEKLVNFIV